MAPTGPAERSGFLDERSGSGPVLPGFGLRTGLPLGLLLHLGGLWLLIHSSLALHRSDLPPVESAIDAHRVLLFAPPAAGIRLGDPTAAPEPEDRATPALSSEAAAPLTAPQFVPNDLLAELAEIEQPPAGFGSAEGIPEGILEGLEFGTAEGVVGGVPDGVAGGQIGGLPQTADPVLPPPDEPPVPISLPRPRFPGEALRDGVRGRVVLRALINEQGTVEVLRILRSVPALDAEAVRVVESEWRFRPAQLRGRPAPALSDLVVRFSLR